MKTSLDDIVSQISDYSDEERKEADGLHDELHDLSESPRASEYANESVLEELKVDDEVCADKSENQVQARTRPRRP